MTVSDGQLPSPYQLPSVIDGLLLLIAVPLTSDIILQNHFFTAGVMIGCHNTYKHWIIIKIE